ncbi:Zinc finger CCCH domain-containing protein 5 [Heracleum sosnowskyi]|uniref:Zinc finger CCCH domain-containing protein 5 n=1 Tax=Heracleum sosnowskyi TaxID=360622 RepID=A0AAD8IK37_9APIA|nr:Zinc finger CCCH domain-containing protein 5 [Heracleum sosnowskyi]
MSESPPIMIPASDSRKEKRKALKKEKRKQLRKELAEKARLAEESRLNDPEELKKIQLEEERERERVERERREFEERERLFLEAVARKREEEEEEERRRELEEEQAKKNLEEDEPNEDDDWEYVEEGPPEIIWQGNEIIVKKNRVKVKKKKDSDQHIRKEDADRPTSNPLPPQSEVFSDYQSAPPISAQQLLENVAQEFPNFGTEQDKAHCPFHIKTGACRFGTRCSRVHFYPDRSCTLLMKNMYNGPGLAWEQDEGLECMDEEVECSYEEFYEDVHTEFLKYGEIVNFKVCKNGAFHLRGNLYVHYKSLDSAVMAYHAMNGRFFAGKQVKCEFVGVTRWKIAICGEFMKSRLKTCTRGTACNFIHCFRNPGGDYEWADWDKPPPRFWVIKMNALFGNSNSDETRCGKQMKEEHMGKPRKSNRQLPEDGDRYHSRRSQSMERDSCDRRSSRSRHEDHDTRKRTDGRRLNSRDDCKRHRTLEENSCKETNSRRLQHRNNRTSDTDSAGDYSDIEKNGETFQGRTKKGSRGLHSKVKELGEYSEGRRKRTHETDTDGDFSDCDTGKERRYDNKLNHNSLTSKRRTEYKYKDICSSRTHEYSYDGDLSDSDMKRGRHQGYRKKSSGHSEEVSEMMKPRDGNG